MQETIFVAESLSFEQILAIVEGIVDEYIVRATVLNLVIVTKDAFRAVVAVTELNCYVLNCFEMVPRCTAPRLFAWLLQVNNRNTNGSEFSVSEVSSENTRLQCDQIQSSLNKNIGKPSSYA